MDKVELRKWKENADTFLEETVHLSPSLDLRIKQYGCETIVAEFGFTFKAATNSTRDHRSNLIKAARALKGLKLSSKGRSVYAKVDQIAKAVEKESKKALAPKERSICLIKGGSECIADITLTYKYPSLEIIYGEGGF